VYLRKKKNKKGKANLTEGPTNIKDLIKRDESRIAALDVKNKDLVKDSTIFYFYELCYDLVLSFECET
jgi:hypothetical protein